MSAGKGDTPRNNSSRAFRENFEAINWGKNPDYVDTKPDGLLARSYDGGNTWHSMKYPKSKKPKTDQKFYVTQFESPRPSEVINDFQDLMLDQATRQNAKLNGVHKPCRDCKKPGAWGVLGRCPECYEQLLADYKEKARS